MVAKGTNFFIAFIALLISVLGQISYAQDLGFVEGSTDTSGSYTFPKNAVNVDVFFATDRNRKGIKSKIIKGDKKYIEKFGNDSEGITYGSCVISVPLDRDMGDIDVPSIFKLEFIESEGKHFILNEAVALEKDDYYEAINNVLRRQLLKEGKKNSFIFIHGNDVSFEYAAKRTAQMAYDLDFHGPPVFYSWPSRPWYWWGLLGYWKNQKTIESKETKKNIYDFLTSYFKNSDADEIYVIAHSLGTRAVSRVVSEWAVDNKEYAKRLKQVFLTAPDIDAKIFKDEIVRKIKDSKVNFTVLASRHDKALLLSNIIHLGKRAGQISLYNDEDIDFLNKYEETGADEPGLPENITVIDASRLSTFIGRNHRHTKRRTVLSDIYYYIDKGFDTEERFGLRKVTKDKKQYWVIE